MHLENNFQNVYGDVAAFVTIRLGLELVLHQAVDQGEVERALVVLGAKVPDADGSAQFHLEIQVLVRSDGVAGLVHV